MHDMFDRLNLTELTQEQLQPLEALMPASWPDVWRSFATSYYITLLSAPGSGTVGVRTEQYFKYGGPTSKEGFAEANAVKKAYERAKAELEARMAKESQKALDSSAEDETPDRPRTTGGRSSGESTSGGRGSSGVRSPGGSSDNAGIAPGYQGLGSSSGSGSGGGGNGVGVSPDGPTFISNVTIPGLGSAQFEFPDSASQQRGTDLLRRLAAAKRTANR
jgi:hypothetical protein